MRCCNGPAEGFLRCHRRHFESLATACILANTLAMALVWDGMPAGLSRAVDLANCCFTLLFLLELLVKLAGLGPSQYAAEKMNLFDALVVAASVADLAADLLLSSYSAGGALSAFRTLRCVCWWLWLLAGGGCRELLGAGEAHYCSLPGLAG